MKILYLTFDDLNAPGAWSVHVRSVVNGLVSRGHDVRLVAPGGRAPGMDAPCDALREGRWSHLAGSLGTFVRSAKAFDPDVLYVRGIHVSVTPAVAAARVAKPLVVEVNGLLEFEAPSKLRRTAVRMTHRFTLGRAARVVTVSPLLKDALARRYGVPEDRIDVVPNGADTGRFRPADALEARRRLKLPTDRQIVVCVATFYRHHGLDLLVDAVSRTGALLVLVGGGTLSGGNVVSTGRVAHELVPDYVAAADVCAYVLKTPHRTFGFSPLKVYEYMAAGRPVAAATDLEEISSFINRSGVGRAVALDPDALGRAIQDLLADERVRAEAGRKGRSLAESTYNWSRAVDQVEQSLRLAVGK